MDKEFASPSRSFTVFEARPEDLPAACALILRVINEDLGYEGIPEWAGDVRDPHTAYLDNPRHALFVAVETGTGEVLGTTGVRAGGPGHPPHPRWLADRYDPDTTAQLVRAYVAHEHRLRGVARALVEAARRFIAAEGGYQTIYLHTHGHIPGAEPFWRAMSTTEIYDARAGGDPTAAIHFELALPD